MVAGVKYPYMLAKKIYMGSIGDVKILWLKEAISRCNCTDTISEDNVYKLSIGHDSGNRPSNLQSIVDHNVRLSLCHIILDNYNIPFDARVLETEMVESE